MADNRVPAELIETISPGYRMGDMKSTKGTQFVWVNRIEGQDSDGQMQVLFSDRRGALLPLSELTRANKLINPLSVKQKGRYQKLHLQLANKTLSINSTGMKQLPLPNGISTSMVLHGQLEINKFEVSASEFSLQQPVAQTVALLNH